MSCPLHALANIAALTADCRLMRQEVNSYHTTTPTCTTADQPSSSDFYNAIHPSLSSHRSSTIKEEHIVERRPMKKRFVPIDERSHDIACYNARENDYEHLRLTPKKKKARTSSTNGNKKNRLNNVSHDDFLFIKSKNSMPSFPVILMGILSAPQNKECISFLSDEQSFIIVHQDMLVSHVLPMHFENYGHEVPTFEHFERLLTAWGFETMTEPKYPQVKVYKHPMFRKGDWEACLHMVPLGNRNGKETKKISSPKLAPIKQESPSPRLGPIKQESFSSINQEEVSIAVPAPAYSRPSVSPVMARSVTPPEVPQQPSQETSATQEWTMRSASLEQLIKATAKTRKHLTRMGTMTSSNTASSPSLEELNMSDAQVKLVTNDIVSAAMAALHNEGTWHQNYMKDVNNISPSNSISSRLDTMTEKFIERSNGRTKRTRPIGILGSTTSSTSMGQLSDVVDAQTRAMLARKRGQHQ